MAENNYNKINDSPRSSVSSIDQNREKRLLEHADNDDRLGFVKKVYAILSTQLIITFGFVTVVKMNEGLDRALHR